MSCCVLGAAGFQHIDPLWQRGLDTYWRGVVIVACRGVCVNKEGVCSGVLRHLFAGTDQGMVLGLIETAIPSASFGRAVFFTWCWLLSVDLNPFGEGHGMVNHLLSEELGALQLTFRLSSAATDADSILEKERCIGSICGVCVCV